MYESHSDYQLVIFNAKSKKTKKERKQTIRDVILSNKNFLKCNH